MGKEFRWKELRHSHRTRPGGTHLFARHAELQQAQGVNEFVAEHVFATADIGLCRQHLYGIMWRFITAKCCFASPDRKDRIAVNTDVALNAVKHFIMFAR